MDTYFAWMNCFRIELFRTATEESRFSLFDVSGQWCSNPKSIDFIEVKNGGNIILIFTYSSHLLFWLLSGTGLPFGKFMFKI